ncbi:transketolase [Hyphobacterium sp. HN65]|uniref:Transketolase n=1 Tax=Hyphobacterium lacteum TaxID=3116575 RepID=A0ABU7LPS2_9PROT|nr:transketolase [Hyphobacterium sp. HN65]MEE2525897.1 transketolase [Hyphobacterium sp. HN65]
MTSLDLKTLKPMANAVRALAMDAVEQAKSGHPGMPMGMADAATVLWSRHLKFDPADPYWKDRDRFVLSAGHGSMLIYALLHLAGYADVTLDQIKNFRQLHSCTPGHPEYGHTSGVETTTGPLGQGIATAVGMALAERILNARFGDDLVDHRTWVIASDGDLQEGVSHEAISLAGHMGLNRLIVLWDDNSIQIDGSTELAEHTDVLKRFEAAGWATDAVDGHNMDEVDAALERAKASDKPVLISCKTIIGFGAPTKAGKASSHGSPLGGDELAAAKKAIGWPHAAFDVPDDIRADWKAVTARGAAAREAWQGRLDNSPRQSEFEEAFGGGLNEAAARALEAWRKELAAEKPDLASRASSGKTLEQIVPAMRELVGGSADLTGSNNTRTPDQQAIQSGKYSGQYIHYGVREHGMAACANGMALHGGVRPYIGTFLVFADYCRPAIRLSALMNQNVTYVFTHDSIGLGEDGPTHQPVEHLAALRAIPLAETFRPADALETAECWEAALSHTNCPGILALSRQTLPFLRDDDGSINKSMRGAYVLRDEPDAKAVIIATGSEVAIAVEAQEKLKARGVPVRVVSAPCLDRFMIEDGEYQAEILPDGLPRVAVEAGIRQGWDAVIGRDGGFVGMTGFGASAPAEVLYDYFGITAERVIEEVMARV